jgi:hypothetical protein
MTDRQERTLTLAYRFASAGTWAALNRFADHDGPRGDTMAWEAAAPPAEDAGDIWRDDAGTRVGACLLAEARDLHRLLLVDHPDLAAGFPYPDAPDHFAPAERAIQMAAILAGLVRRLKAADRPPGRVEAVLAEAGAVRPVMMTAAKVTAELGIPPSAAAARLRGARRADRTCFLEVSDRRSTEPTYLYYADVVLPLIRDE